MSNIETKDDRSAEEQRLAQEKVEKLALAKQMIADQETAIETMKRQQAEALEKLGFTMAEITGEPPTKKRKLGNSENTAGNSSSLLYDIRTELTADDSANAIDEADSATLLSTQDKLVGALDEMGEEITEEDVAEEYQTMLSATEEELGDPISAALANACKRSFGQYILDTKVKEEMMKKIKLPRNMKIMKTQRLNPEIYMRLRSFDRTKDEAASTRLRDISKSVIQLLKGLDKITEAKDLMKKAATARIKSKQEVSKEEQEAYDKLNEAGKFGQECYNVLNYFITDATRKRRYAICHGLGQNFTSIAGMKQERNDDSEMLFDDETMKKMRYDLKKLPIVGTKTSKNDRSFGKSPRSSSGASYNRNGNGYNSNSNNNNSNGYDRYNNNGRYNNYNNHNNNNNYNNNNNNKFRNNNSGKGPFKKRR